jgi:hypothetical protein
MEVINSTHNLIWYHDHIFFWEKVFENNYLRRIIGHKGEGITGGQRKLQNN